jgi:hypothetical protein
LLNESSSNNNNLHVSTAGDLNGDGFADVVVSNTGDEHATVFFGSSTGISETRSVRITQADTPLPGDAGAFGASIATAGDVDGDGLCEVLIATPGYRVAGVGNGRVYLYRGASGTGFSSTAFSILSSPDTGAAFGSGIDGVGDVNGDGFGDVVVGAYADSSNTGRAFVFLGSAIGIPTSASATINAPDFRGLFGQAVARIGDVNGDGFFDVGIGAPALGVGGEALVYNGGAAGVAASPSATLSTIVTNAMYGSSLALRWVPTPRRFVWGT